MSPVDSIGLVFFPDTAGARQALRDVRHYGLRRSVSIQRTGDAPPSVEGSHYPLWLRTATLALTATTATAIVLLQSWIRDGPASGQIAIGIALVIFTLTTIAVFTRAGIGVDRHIIARYRRWLMPGESLLIVTLPSRRVEDLQGVLRRHRYEELSVFIVGPETPEPTVPPHIIRHERLTVERISRHAIELASEHATSLQQDRFDLVSAMLDAADRTIDAITARLSASAEQEQGVSSAAEWLLDNAYLIQQHTVDARRNLSKDIPGALPVVRGGQYAGQLRAYALANEFVGLTDGEVTEEEITLFLKGYQRAQPLMMAEIWELPLMLRVALLQLVSTRAVEIGQRQHEHERADFWANRLLSAARHDPDQLMFALALLAGEAPDPSPYIVDRLLSQTQGEPLAFDAARAWLEHKMSMSIPEVIDEEQRHNAYDLVTLANAITSLRRLGSLDWTGIFERVSLVDHILRDDPTGTYAAMDVQTRDWYRHALEALAADARIPEVDAARTVVAVASRHTANDLERHIGHYLIGDGRVTLETVVNARPAWRTRLVRWIRDHPALALPGTVALLTMTLLAAAHPLIWPGELRLIPVLTYIASVGTIAILASEAAVQIVTLVASRLLPTQPLPKLSLNDGIPAAFRTLVVTPEMLPSADAARASLSRMETRYLANRDPNLLFGMLVDLPDAPHRIMPEDDVILAQAIEGTAELNRKHEGSPFLVFVRGRRWSKTERAWMGWERKRGNLEELNRLLVGAAEVASDLPDDDGRLRLVGNESRLAGIRYVITLDSDTILPRDTARQMIATIAHPLNHARHGPGGTSIVKGYGIIQPRITASLPSATATRFARIFAEGLGVDPYSRLVSNLYQDLTGAASYYGKGIYDPHVMHAVLAGRFPEGSILSHDLLEGAYTRVGLGSDIELFDQFPDTWPAFARREHRWMRGDWQIAAWCTPRIPTPDGWRPNPLGPIDRWKIFDNLRRTLVPLAALILLVTGWLFLRDAGGSISVFVATILLLPALLDAVVSFVTEPASLAFWRHPNVWKDKESTWARGILSIALLPCRAYLSADAILRVFHRRLITRRLLLEWQPSHVERSQQRFAVLWLATLHVGIVGLLLAAGSLMPVSVEASLPYLAAWVAAPVILPWLHRDLSHGAAAFPDPDAQRLRELARLTWRYFDDFVGEGTSWLPPDNYQQVVRVELAHRTSPTNIGLWLLSALTAHDFGYLTIDGLIQRLEHTFRSLDRLEFYEGHLLNWYDVRTLEPLLPRYVSTVDSGNLIASLWAVAQGLEDALDEPLIRPASLTAIGDTLRLLQQAIQRELDPNAIPGEIVELLATVASLCETPPADPTILTAHIRNLAAPTRELAEAIRVLEASQEKAFRQMQLPLLAQLPAQPVERQAVYWADKLAEDVAAWTDTVERYIPWMSELATTPQFRSAEPLRMGSVPSLRELACERNDGPAANQGGSTAARSAVTLMEHLIAHCRDLASGMRMRFLLDDDRNLFSIGFNVETRRLDTSHYDLLASEARIASYVALARGEAGTDHWFSMGRAYARAGRRRTLLSWSGTMFEYLMPSLLLRSFPYSLLDDACERAVEAQIDYGRRMSVPWGISESAFSALDQHHIYQYQAFGVPGLGARRNLADDLVVAPYASALALAVRPRLAFRNMERLAGLGMAGNYGFYDAIDFTPRRQPQGEHGVIVYTFMAHHQAMTLIAIGNALHDAIMVERFHADGRVRASEPVLWERVPSRPALIEHPAPEKAMPVLAPGTGFVAPTRLATVDTPIPRTQLLGSTIYSVMVTNAGGGWSSWRGIDITRWRADTTTDGWGTFIYIRDVESGDIWSGAHHPTRSATSPYSVTFLAHRVEFERRDHGIGTVTEVAVSVEDAAELRRVTLTNYSNRPRTLDVTSYAELALAPHAADVAHPAFSKMFVRTEAVPGKHAILALRKPRSGDDTAIWAAHLLTYAAAGSTSHTEGGFETDRGHFIGRGGSLARPAALDRPLSNTAGWVLDPIFSLRDTVSLAPGQQASLIFVTCAGETRDEVLAMLEKYQDVHVANRAFELTRALTELDPRKLRIRAGQVQQFQQLASHMIFPNAALRAGQKVLRDNRLGQSGLWAHGISGDLPIMLVSIRSDRDLPLVRDVLAAHAYWRLRGFMSDLVILNEEAASYEQPLARELERAIQWYEQMAPRDQRAGIHLLSRAMLPDEDIQLLHAVARVMLVAARGALVRQLAAWDVTPELPPPLVSRTSALSDRSPSLPPVELHYFNGVGGFALDAREFVITIGPEPLPPAPWVNVMANPGFGTMISDAGAGFTWSLNSQANRLTPWSNDPVLDPPGDAIYIRDEDSAAFWTPTYAPIRENGAYRIRHGQGYTIFEHHSHGLAQELVTFVPCDESGGSPVRLQQLQLRNRSSRRRHLSVYGYAEWVLGTDREGTQMHVVTRWDAESHALLAQNRYHPDTGDLVAFASLSPHASSYTADRSEFLGRNGSMADPAALHRQALANRSGAGLDPGAALRTEVTLAPGESVEVTFCVGQARNAEVARALVRRFATPRNVHEALDDTRAWWETTLQAIQVETPDLAANLMLNRWLVYQTLSCRIWGRSGFYQSGGAFGFRDQLQDAMALLYTLPGQTRELILNAAARQFTQGDVQHWWHAGSGAGVRTRISDDLLWLPYVTCQYTRVTGDTGILDEIVPFLEGPELEPDEHERYFVPIESAERGTLAEHCHRAIIRGATTGPHGIPLIGTGDWNDGMNTVGAQGRGESVWLGWFLVSVLNDFAELIEGRGERDRADRYRKEAGRLTGAIEATAWDGDWYRRAWFDDGTPVGSAASMENRIDSLPQSWAVIAGTAKPERARAAMRAVEDRLILDREQLVLLFTPPFEHASPDPGYISKYPPGVRENGGQYTHAAIWVAMAFARLGDGDRAAAVLRMLNPVSHARSLEEVQRYKVEPYVVAADVYAMEHGVGRGGWTWYTGSSGWMYRVWIEEVLGFRLRADQLILDPVIPHDWPWFTLHYRYRSSRYRITVHNPDGINRGVAWVELDGERLEDPVIPLRDDGQTHTVTATLGQVDV